MPPSLAARMAASTWRHASRVPVTTASSRQFCEDVSRAKPVLEPLVELRVVRQFNQRANQSKPDKRDDEREIKPVKQQRSRFHARRHAPLRSGQEADDHG